MPTCGWSGTSGSTTGATSSPPRPKPCAGFSSIAQAAEEPQARRRSPPTALEQLHLEAEETPADFLRCTSLDRLAAKDARKAELVKLRFFAGLTNEQAATALGISASTADNDWAYARAWLGSNSKYLENRFGICGAVSAL